MTMPDKIAAARNLNLRLRTTLESAGLYPRRDSFDQCIAALARRAFNVQHAVVDLSQSQLGAEALILTRSLSEIWFLVRWISNKNVTVRSKRYVEFIAKIAQRFTQVYPKYDMTLEFERLVDHTSLATFADQYSSHLAWADSKIRQMCEEADLHERLISGSPLDASWDYDIPYFILSCYVHSNAWGVGNLFPGIGEPLHFNKISDDKLCDDALVLSMRYLTLVVRRLNIVWDLGIKEAIETIWQEEARGFSAFTS